MALRIVPDYGLGTIQSALDGFGGDPAFGAGDEMQLRAGTHASSAGGHVVNGGTIHAFPGDEGSVIVSAAAAGDTWRVHTATVFEDLICEATAGNDVWSLNVAGCTLRRCTARAYDGRGIYSTQNNQTIEECTCGSAPGATGGIILTGVGGSVINCEVYGTQSFGIRPPSGGTVSHCSVTGTTTRGYNIEVAATVRDCAAHDNVDRGFYLNNALADLDWYCAQGNGTDVELVAGTVGVNAVLADPLWTNAAAGDFSLQPLSPCRDAGTDVGIVVDRIGTARPIGAGFDIGSREFPGVAPQVIDAEADGLTAVVVTFDQAMDPATLGVAAGWTLEALISGTLLAVSSVTLPTTATARLIVTGGMEPATLYRVTAPATAESALGDVVDPAHDTADFVTGAFVQPDRTDLWAFLADPTADASDDRLPFIHQAVYAALFCDARALPEDGDPLADGNPRGWPGDYFNAPGRAAVGSRLWTLSRKRLTEEVAGQARTLAEQALQCLVDEGLCNAVEVTTEIQPADGGGKRLAMLVVTRRDRGDVTLRFADLWKVFDGNN